MRTAAVRLPKMLSSADDVLHDGQSPYIAIELMFY